MKAWDDSYFVSGLFMFDGILKSWDSNKFNHCWTTGLKFKLTGCNTQKQFEFWTEGVSHQKLMSSSKAQRHVTYVGISMVASYTCRQIIFKPLKISYSSHLGGAHVTVRTFLSLSNPVPKVGQWVDLTFGSKTKKKDLVQPELCFPSFPPNVFIPNGQYTNASVKHSLQSRASHVSY